MISRRMPALPFWSALEWDGYLLRWGTPVLLVLVLLVPLLATAEELDGVRVVDCYDGDTCTVNIHGLPTVFGAKLPIRLRGIDAPELKGRCPAESAKALAAKAYLAARLTHAKTVRLIHVGRDKYFRLLVTILADGANINEELVAMGLARPYDGGARQSWC